VAVLNLFSNLDFLSVGSVPVSEVLGGGEEAVEPVAVMSGEEEVADAAELARCPHLQELGMMGC
jgi:hypothetical protein